MADPNLPKSVEKDAEVGKATSASSALTPAERQREEQHGYQIQFQHDAQAEQAKRDEHYVASDGSRPRNLHEAGVGRPLTGTELQRRLELLNPSLVFEPSTYPGRICIKRWILDPVLGETTHYVCAMERGLMPEFSILNFVEEPYFDASTEATPLATGTVKTRLKIDVRNPEIRGWRTVVMRLIKERLITEPDACRVFGLPSHDSFLWQANLR